MDDDRKLRGARVLKVQDPFHDAQLLRDVAIINTQTIEALGALPPGGLPILRKRRPLPLLPETPMPTGRDDEESAMPKMPMQVAAVASLALAACATPGAATPKATQMQENAPVSSVRYTYPETPVVTTGELVPEGDPAIAAKMNYKPVEWPLRFEKHSFGPRCYNTLECHVIYDNFDFGGDKPTRSSASYGPDYLKDWNGSYGAVPNFPSAAKVVWRSKDGSSHKAEIDIGEIFKDQLMRHFVPREEAADLPDGKNESPPSILLEVNDRVIRVYMVASVPTKHLQKPGNRYSTSRRDLVLVKTYTY
ncbi:hypothetical protein [Stenotrophomonas sp. ISL-67]|uniref:hypothetical protein n=1 Tax=Stenotrophomonas sp. ISL-67 TaxID=2819171 RepID=UPI0020351BAD|nr:hypothetical protein [Stenotrophomonas sp. ISL-67]